MLTAQDDLIGQQTSATFPQVDVADPRFTERYWYTAHAVDGAPLLFDAGLGYYPNRGVMDAFAGITIGTKQHNFRASRRLGVTPLQSAVGPLRFEVLEGMKRHRLTLADNGSGLSFDVTFEATFPGAQEKRNFREREGKVEEDLARVTQFGRYSGWIVADGKRYEVTPATWWGQRDHSCGVRSELRTDESEPPVHRPRSFFWTWSMFQFESSALSMFLTERAPDKPLFVSGTEFRRQPDGSLRQREVLAVRHELDWVDDPLGQTVSTATFTFDFAEGAPRIVHMKGLPTRFFLKAGMYGGLDGWKHGDDKGELHQAHDVWDLTDAATRQKARTLGDHAIEATSEGERGFGISEYGVAPGYALYTVPQRHPAF